MREFCQASRPTGTQRGNKSDPLYIYTQEKKRKTWVQGTPRSHVGLAMWGSSCSKKNPGDPHRLDSVTTRRRLLHWCQGSHGPPWASRFQGVLLSLEHPGQPTPSRQRHDPKATAALVSRMPGA